MAVKPIPDGYHTVTPYLIVDDAAKALEFYKKAFGATERFRMAMPNGRVGHAEIQIGNSRDHAGRRVPRDGGEVREDARRLAGGHLPVRRGRGRLVRPGGDGRRHGACGR